MVLTTQVSAITKQMNNIDFIHFLYRRLMSSSRRKTFRKVSQEMVHRQLILGKNREMEDVGYSLKNSYLNRNWIDELGL